MLSVAVQSASDRRRVPNDCPDCWWSGLDVKGSAVVNDTRMYLVISDIGTDRQYAIVEIDDLGQAIRFAERLAANPHFAGHTIDVRRKVDVLDHAMPTDEDEPWPL